mmetsp:Transcript_64569/g.120209  ORF Transcript_64569/g.120209 Transcript_64569/m.120209 type:complete len:174 (-) Transcript_64569:107-628(-)
MPSGSSSSSSSPSRHGRSKRSRSVQGRRSRSPCRRQSRRSGSRSRSSSRRGAAPVRRRHSASRARSPHSKTTQSNSKPSATAPPPVNGKAEVVEAKTRHNGDPTYQAEIYMSHGEGLGGGARSMAIRGPCRYERWQAEDDADALQKETAQGIKAVKVLAAKLKQGKIKTSELP